MLSFLNRQIRLFIVVLVGYLAHVSIMPYISMGGVSPSLTIAVTAIVIVGYGLLRGVWVGALYGIVLEVMLPSVPMMNLLLYPVSALLCGLFFADKSASRLQYERTVGKAARNRSPYLRTALCALVNTVIYEVVNMVYMYLAGGALSLATLERALGDMLLTTLLTIVIMAPVRYFLGFRKQMQVQAAQQRFDYRPERDKLV